MSIGVNQVGFEVEASATDDVEAVLNEPVWGPSTCAVHRGRRANPYHAISEPVVQAATYTFKNTSDLCNYKQLTLLNHADGRNEYGRYGNPTIAAAETRLAALEAAEDALLFPSGMAAITTALLGLLETGDHLLLTDDCYRQTRLFCQDFLKRLGIHCSIVPFGDNQALQRAIQPNTRLILSETPTNPYLRILDLEFLVEIAHRHGVKTLVDTTFATPLNLRPLEWGIDLVVHSATKYLAGHNDLLCGCLAGDKEIISGLREYQGMSGAIADPACASLLLRGLKTLGLRIERTNSSAQVIAEGLEAHPAIERVWYPGLASHPDHAIAHRQLSGFGGVMSFTVKGGGEAASRFIDALEIPLIATSLGGAETLVSQPALMAYYELTRQERQALGIQDNLVRLAVGIEDTRDLIADINQGLNMVI